MAFIEDNVWKCQDNVTLINGLHCGKTNHFTDFTILLKKPSNTADNSAITAFVHNDEEDNDSSEALPWFVYIVVVGGLNIGFDLIIFSCSDSSWNRFDYDMDSIFFEKKRKKQKTIYYWFD